VSADSGFEHKREAAGSSYIDYLGDIFMIELLLQLICHIDADKIKVLSAS
jgi:hypothetical protein